MGKAGPRWREKQERGTERGKWVGREGMSGAEVSRNGEPWVQPGSGERSQKGQHRGRED